MNAKKNGILKVTLLIASFTQMISPALSSFNDNGQTENTSPQITPAGYTFAVWGVITFLSFAYGIYQILPQRKNSELHDLVSAKLIFVYLLFSCWLFAAERDWLIITVIIFLAMFSLNYFTFQQILESKNELTIYEKIFLEGQLGIYLGWCTIAVFANTGAALKFYGLSDLATTGILWQTLLLVAALTNGIYGLYKTKSNYFLGGTILWAFIGIFFGLKFRLDTTILQIVVAVAIIIFLIAFYRFRSRMHRQF